MDQVRIWLVMKKAGNYDHVDVDDGNEDDDEEDEGG